MKKFVSAALCCILCAGALMAQNQSTRNMTTRTMNAVPVQMVADTTISNHIGLSADQMKQVDALNKAFVEKMRVAMNNRPDKGTTMTDEAREAFQKQAADTRSEALKELRKVMGDDKYILYLEKSLDAVYHNMFNAHNQGAGPRGGQPAPRGGKVAPQVGKGGPRIAQPVMPTGAKKK